MNQIHLQNKTEALKGKIEIYWFENEYKGLKQTLFHRIYIPLKRFNSGLDYESQPLETEIVIEWLNLKLEEPSNLNNLKIKSVPKDKIEVSIYVGSAHNPCDIQSLTLKRIDNHLYEAECDLFVDFEHEGVAGNEEFKFKTELELDPIIKE